MFFFNDPATTEIYTLTRHDALPILVQRARSGQPRQAAPKVTDRFGLIGRVTPFGQVTVPAAASTVKSSRDRKSTRLNSSHANISYAVFCLKNKKFLLLF